MSMPAEDKELRLAKLLHRLDESMDGSLVSDDSQITEELEQLSLEQIQNLRDAKSCLAYLDQIRQLEQGSTDDQAGQTRTERSKIDLPFSPVAPERIGRYEIRDLIGQGGFAKVYLAFDPVLDREVALKIPRPESFRSVENRSRFRREAQAAATLAHPSIISVFDAGTDGPYEFISFDYCKGETLGSLLNRVEVLSPKVVASTVSQLALALAHAHSRNIVHRDVKPGNILVDALVHDENDPESLAKAVRIADFGLVKIGLDENAKKSLTVDGAIVGTPAFMSPEQVRASGNVGPESDLFSLGSVMYLMLTGVVPHKCKTHFDTFTHITEKSPKPLRAINSAIPNDLEAICLKCLNKSPGSRYANATELSEDLQRWLSGHPIRARMPSSLEKVKLWVRRNRMAATSLLFAILVLVTGTAFSTTKWLEAAHEREVSATALQTATEKTKTTEDILNTFLLAYEEMSPRKTGKPTAPLAEDVLFIVRRHASNELSDDDPAKAKLLGMMADCFDSIGKYKACAECRLEQVAVSKLAYGEDSREILETREQLALSQCQCSDFKAAAATQREIVDQIERQRDPATEQLLLAKSTLLKYETIAGEDLSEDPIAILAESDGALRDAEVQARIAENAAHILYASRNFQQLVDLISPRLALLEEELGEDSLLLAKLKRWVAKSYCKLKQFDLAIEMQQQVVSIRDNNKASRSVEDRKILASILRASKEPDNLRLAIEITKEAIAEVTKVFGPNHPIPITSTQELAKLYVDVGQFAQAAKLLESTLECCNAGLEENSPYIAQVMFDLARANQLIGKVEIAKQLVEDAVAINRSNKNLAPQLEERNLRHLARGHELCSDRKAGDYFNQLLEHQERWRGSSNQHSVYEYALHLFSRGGLQRILELLDDKSAEDAEQSTISQKLKLLRTAANIELDEESDFETDDFENLPIESAAILRIARATRLLRQEEYREAEEILLATHTEFQKSSRTSAYARYWSIRRDNQFLLDLIGQKLVQVYSATNEPEKMKLWIVDDASR